MKCPFCGTLDTKVIDSRPSDDRSEIRRRRKCEACGRRFTTYEKAEAFPWIVVKKDNTREPYDRSKLEAGILRSCYKCPVSIQQINELLDQLENALFSEGEREVPSTEIGEQVMMRLKDLDEVAYIRFASVYREFTDVNAFAEELKSLLRKKKRTASKAKKAETKKADAEAKEAAADSEQSDADDAAENKEKE